jgi:hypothetical protein
LIDPARAGTITSVTTIRTMRGITDSIRYSVLGQSLLLVAAEAPFITGTIHDANRQRAGPSSGSGWIVIPANSGI